MYSYVPPTPLVIDLNDSIGFGWRQQASNFVNKTRMKGIEKGSLEEQGYGKLAEIVVGEKLGIKPDAELSYDIKLASGIKIDVKCRSGSFPFQEQYLGSGGITREAKHNLFTRQIYDTKLDADVYLMTHLRIPDSNELLPGTPRQKSWILFICGWIAKSRVLNEGVFLPRGSLTEQGHTWFSYRANNTEIYNRHLNGVTNLSQLLLLDKKDVDNDSQKPVNLHLTSIDAVRIGLDLVGRVLIPQEVLSSLKTNLNFNTTIPPVFHPNQYIHLAKWLKNKNLINVQTFEEIKTKMPEVEYQDDSQKI